MKGFELTRTFHPVGQGAFYTEVFSKNVAAIFSVVYDCGTGTKAVDMSSLVDSFKSSIKQIDILFISHFHSDHISGLDRLLDGMTVKKTVIPMLPEDTVTLMRVQNLLEHKKDALAFDSIISDLYLSNDPPTRYGDIVLVNNYDNSIKVKAGMSSRKVVESGFPLFGVDNMWEYIPFNSVESEDQRTVDFVNELMNISGAVDDSGKLNVSGLIRGCRTEVRKLYERVMKNTKHNLYTMTLESRPTDSIALKSDSKISSEERCLYLGDFDSVGNDQLWNRFIACYDYKEIGMIQIPHHGSKDNWRDEFLNGGPRAYFVSAGTKNSFHHPDFWVMKDVFDSGSESIVVSEKSGWSKEFAFEFKVKTNLS